MIYRICESTLTPAKIQQVITVLLKQSRDQSFAGNCRIIQSVKGLQKTSALFCPQPFLDKDSLIRVGRRLQKADLPQQSIHLTIFHLAKLIVQNLHITSRHACPSMMLANVSKSYYIIGVKCLIRSILKNCVACQTTCLRTASQQMGQLLDMHTLLESILQARFCSRGVTLENL